MYKNVGARPGCGVRIHGSVGQRCRAKNEESPALPVARARSVSIGAMDEKGSKMRTLTCCDAKITRTCRATGQFKGQFKGAMEEMSQKVQNASSHKKPLCTHKAHGQFSGAMDEGSGKVQDASTQKQCCHGCCSLQS